MTVQSASEESILMIQADKEGGYVTHLRVQYTHLASCLIPKLNSLIRIKNEKEQPLVTCLPL